MSSTGLGFSIKVTKSPNLYKIFHTPQFMRFAYILLDYSDYIFNAQNFYFLFSSIKVILKINLFLVDISELFLFFMQCNLVAYVSFTRQIKLPYKELRNK